MITEKDRLRRARIDALQEMDELYRRKASSGNMTPVDMRKYKAILEELVKLQRIEKARWDLIYFAEEYFGEERCSNPEHVLLLKETPVCQFHRELCQMIMEVKDSPGSARMAIASARGHSKSTFGSQINLAHSILFSLTHYTVVISAVRKIAVDLISWVTSVLKTNAKVIEDFGLQMDPVPQRNELDRDDSFITKSGIRVDAISMLAPARGMRHMQYRPDLILDDIEMETNISSKEQKTKALQYFNSTIMPMPSPTNSKIYYVGTILAKGSLLDTVLKQGSWKTRVWSAIEQEADRQDMWGEFRDRYLDFNNPDRYHNAMNYYESNKNEMDKGARVLWPERLPYVKLQLLKYDLGVRAFSSEYMNKPSSGDDVVFDLDRIIYYDHHDDEFIYDGDNKIPLSECDIVASVDTARGKETGDWTAFTIGAKAKTGVIYILVSYAIKVGQLGTVEKALEYIRKYKPSKFVVESVGYSGELAVLLQTEITRLGLLGTKVVELKSKGRKEIRIQSCEPYLHNGTVRLHKSQYMLQSELNDFRAEGSPGHDDSIDSLSMLLGEMLGKTNTSVLEYYRSILNKEREVKGMLTE